MCVIHVNVIKYDLQHFLMIAKQQTRKCNKHGMPRIDQYYLL